MRITQGACARKMAKAATKGARGRVEGRSLQTRGRAGRSIRGGRRAADAAVQSTTQQLEEAKAACAEGGCEEGTFWWLDREFEEQMSGGGPQTKSQGLEARTASRRKSGTYCCRRSGPESPVCGAHGRRPLPLS